MAGTKRKRTPTKKPKASRGRPSKFKPETVERLKKLARYGWTDEQMAEFVGITTRTLANWKSSNKEFFHALKEEKDQADQAVEKSLYQRACGWSCPEHKVVTYEGKVTDTVEITKHYPGDTTAQIFWLKNRQPHKYRDRVDIREESRRTLVVMNADGTEEDEFDY